MDLCTFRHILKTKSLKGYSRRTVQRYDSDGSNPKEGRKTEPRPSTLADQCICVYFSVFSAVTLGNISACNGWKIDTAAALSNTVVKAERMKTQFAFEH